MYVMKLISKMNNSKLLCVYNTVLKDGAEGARGEYDLTAMSITWLPISE